MTALTLDQVSAQLVSLQPDGSELPLGRVTDDLAWSEQTGDQTVTVTAALQNVDDIGDGRDLWTALGGNGGRYRVDASWDGQTVQAVWEGSAWECTLRSTGRDAIDLVCYDDLRTLVTDEVYYIGLGPGKENASQWLTRVLTDGGPVIGDVSRPTATIRQYLFQGQPRAQIVDQILRWAFYRTPKTNADGTANPDKVPFMLQMRLAQREGPGDAGTIWAASTVKPGTNSLVFAFDASTCAEFEDHQSIQQLVGRVTLYSTAALIQGSTTPYPYPGGLSADFAFQRVAGPNGQQQSQIVQTNPSYTPPANLGPLRRVLGGGGSDSPQVMAEVAQDTLAVFGSPWKVRTVVVPLLPMIRRGDVHHFSVGDLDDFYPVTGVVHSFTKRQTILTLDTSGVLGRRVVAQQFIGVQGQTGGPETGTGDTAAAPPSTSSATGAAAQAIGAALDQNVRGKPYTFGGPEGRSTMDAPSAFTSTDCSGFVSWAYYVGSGGSVDLRSGQSVSTLSLYAETTAVPPDQARPGDLVFYNMSQPDMHLQHVALFLGDGQKVQEGGSGRGVNVASVTDIGTPEYRRLSR